MGKKDLIQFSGRSTPEERRDNAIKAGKASGVARQKRRLMRDVLANILTVEVTEPELRDKLEQSGLPATHEAAICYAAVIRAGRGDIEAARFVRDTMGEKPAAMLAVAPLQDVPVSYMDLSKFSDDELRAMAAMRAENN